MPDYVFFFTFFFDFFFLVMNRKKNCLICGENLNLKKKKKKWRRVGKHFEKTKYVDI